MFYFYCKSTKDFVDTLPTLFICIIFLNKGKDYLAIIQSLPERHGDSSQVMIHTSAETGYSEQYLVFSLGTLQPRLFVTLLTGKPLYLIICQIISEMSLHWSSSQFVLSTSMDSI